MDTITPTGKFDSLLILHGDKAAYVRRLYALFRRYYERAAEELEIGLVSLGAFLRCGQYGQFKRSAYPRMVSGCDGGSALLYASLGSIKSWARLVLFC